MPSPGTENERQAKQRQEHCRSDPEVAIWLFNDPKRAIKEEVPYGCLKQTQNDVFELHYMDP